MECASPIARFGTTGEVEFEPEDYWNAFLETVGSVVRQAPDVEDIWLCSEMHGFMLVKTDSATPLTPYISWQDQRASFAFPGAHSTMEDLQCNESDFLRHTGMRLRSGLPGLNLIHMAHKIRMPIAARFATLSDWLMLRGGEKDPLCHLTLAAGTGLYSLVERAWRPKIISGNCTDLSEVQFPQISTLANPIGRIRLADRSLRVWGGIGDMQAAAHGSTFPQGSDIIINLGTGSQVMATSSQGVAEVDRRVSATGQEFFAVTHIPSGRALNVFASFMDEIAVLGGGTEVFWKIFSELKAQDILNAAPAVDLNVFDAAWKYAGGGNIRSIQEHHFHPRNLVLDIVSSWLKQYVEALAIINPNHSSKTFLLTGGLSRRAEFIPTVLEQLLHRRCIMPQLRTGEDTLDGLLFLAENQRISDQLTSEKSHHNETL